MPAQWKPNPETTPDLWPLCETRALAACFLAGSTLRKLQEKTCVTTEDISIQENAWIDPADLQAFLAAANRATLIDAQGQLLAWRGSSAAPAIPTSRSASTTGGPASFLIHYPWDLLRLNEQLMARTTESHWDEGQVHPAAHIDGILVLGPGSQVLPGVYVEGKVLVGKNCKIGPNCYLRGSTAIGDRVRIGQAVEIKNSIIASNSVVGHLSYVGDSILGEEVNFGAGTLTANLKHDGTSTRSNVGGALRETGRRKLGAIIGDSVHTGIHTAIYPGRKLGPGTITLPHSAVSEDLKG